ncbi:uncharacterized protein [Ptychodera flava]|uniref:uncharacterized protein n=1 Tax=Ptychodera flava TaxID=63121 RepID=UPI00396A71D1
MLPRLLRSTLTTLFSLIIATLLPFSESAECFGNGTLATKKVMFESSCGWSYLAVSKPIPNLSAFTICVWIRSSDASENGTIFSYATMTSTDELGLYLENGDLILVVKSQVVTGANAGIYDGVWHIVCAKWKSDAGRWALLVDAQPLVGGAPFAMALMIEEGGTAFIGQGQGVLGGGFSRSRCFSGDMANFNLWSNALGGPDLRDISQNCLGDLNCGDVISWNDFKSTDLTNAVLLVSDTCGNSAPLCRTSIHLRKDYQGEFVGNVITLPSENSAMDCARRCAKMSTCRSIDYSKEQQVCQLSRGSVGNTPDMVQYEDSVRYEVVNTLNEASANPCANQPCNPGEICQATCEAYDCVPPVPTCADCTNPGTPLNGQQSGGFQHGDTVTFSCDVGYTLDGASSTDCSDGSWTDPLPLCRSFPDCGAVLAFGFISDGIYYIKPAGLAAPVQVFCDMTTDGGGWTVIQNRVNKTVNFKREWQEYKDGFGVLGWGYWFGNDNIHHLTAQNTYILRVDVVDFSDNLIWGKYDTFSIGNEASLYTMTIGSQLDGNEADQITYHNGQPFSTVDSDNDNNEALNCAEEFMSAWWYKKGIVQSTNIVCYSSDLNKPFIQNCPLDEGVRYGNGIGGISHCARKTSMKVKA